jgi:DNA sulfur modification protein DndB
MTNNVQFGFHAIRGIQAGREYYVAMCPLRLISTIFKFDGEELSPEIRAQRTLNRSRVPEIARYMTNNPNDYVFSAITASIDGEVRFREALDGGPNGMLEFSNANCVINDGQHRRAAIEMAIKNEPRLADESIAVVFFVDRGLERSQQMFADLNRHAIRPSKSLGLLYDHRVDMAQIAKLTGLKSNAFVDLVEMERSALSERSRKLFTLSGIHSACLALLDATEVKDIQSASEICISFWNELDKCIPDWGNVRKGRLSSCEVRKDMIHPHAIVLQAIGKAGCQLMAEQPKTWKQTLKKLAGVNWSRKNAKVWERRTLVHGRVTKTSTNLILTTNYIKQTLGLNLSPDEKREEEAYKRG